MKVRYIKSATVVIEHEGKKVLCDPWLTDGIYYGSWYSFPKCQFTAADFQDIDYLYISHVHPDHCDTETLKDLPKHIPVLILDFEEKFLLRTLQKIGFTKIIEVPHNGEYQLGPDFKVELFSGDNNDFRRFSIIYGCSEPRGEKTRQIDSMAVFSGGGRVVVNSNDVPVTMIAGAFEYIRDKYKAIDLLLVSYAGAGPYPQAYSLTHEEMIKGAIGSSYTFLSFTLQYIISLKPRFFIPYAGEYVLGSRMWWMNKFKGTSEIEELLVDLVPYIGKNGAQSEMVLLNRGESFDVDSGQASAPYKETDFLERNRYTKLVLSNKKLLYEQPEYQVERTDIMAQLVEAREALWNKQKDFLYYGNVDLYIDVGFDYLYKMSFSNKDISKVDRKPGCIDNSNYIHAQLDYRLMRMILDRKANWNNAEIGSHVLLSEYYGKKSQAGRSYEAMPHFLMPYFQKPLKKTVSPEVGVLA